MRSKLGTLLQTVITLWLFNIAMEAMALIEIDGLPIHSMVIFHGYVRLC